MAEGQAGHTHVSEIVGGLRSLGWDVELVSPRPSSRGIARRLAAIGETLWRVRKASRREWDVVYVRDHPVALPVVRALRRRTRVLAVEVNGRAEEFGLSYPAIRPLVPWLKWMARRRMGSADGLIAVTEGLAAWIREQAPGSAVRIIPNGADVDSFDPVQRDGRTNTAPYAVFFGALSRWKGVDTLLAAAQRPEWPEDLPLVIAGGGEMEAEVQRVVQRTQHVRALGVVAHDDMPGVVCSAELAISPLKEIEGGGSPLKLYESLAAGLPVVVTDVPTQGEIVRTCGCGVVVPSEDPGAMASAVARLHNDPEARTRMGLLGRQAAVSQFSWIARARQTDEFLTELLESRTGV